MEGERRGIVGGEEGYMGEGIDSHGYVRWILHELNKDEMLLMYKIYRVAFIKHCLTNSKTLFLSEKNTYIHI